MTAQTPWDAVGMALRQRMAALALTQAELAKQSGVSDFTLRKIMRGDEGNYRPALLAKIATALGWTPSSIDDILAGGEPSLPEPAPDSIEARLTAIETVLRELREAVRLLDGSPRRDPEEGGHTR